MNDEQPIELIRAIDALETQSARHEDARRRMDRRWSGLMGVVYLAALGGWLATDHTPDSAAWLLPLVVLSVAARWLAGRLTHDAHLFRSGLDSVTLNRLSAMDHVSAVGPLISALDGEYELRYNVASERMAQAALTRLLVRLSSEDAGMLSDRQFRYLRDIAATGGFITSGLPANTELVIASIQALERLGDAEAEPMVASAARYADILPIREAAERSLPGIQAAAARRVDAGTLLRAAYGAAGENCASLVRSAAAAPASDCDALLRSHHTSAVEE